MRYLLLVLRHKWYVFIAGLRLGVPLHLLILHDWTKLSPMEWPHYQRQFFGAADDPLGFSYGWNHHQKTNKHHPEYWVMVTGHNRGGYPDGTPLPMPFRYAMEMVADWMGASRAYEGRWPVKTWPWWENHRDKILAHCDQTTVMFIQMGFVRWELEWNMRRVKTTT